MGVWAAAGHPVAYGPTCAPASSGRQTGHKVRPIIALFTDFGVQDAYVAQMKGVILSINAALTVIDLNHEVAAFDVRQAALFAGGVEPLSAGRQHRGHGGRSRCWNGAPPGAVGHPIRQVVRRAG